MNRMFHIYCDESCHLPNDHKSKMLFGALWCPADKRKSLANKVKKIKKIHKLSPQNEIKWIKVSPSKINFYIDLAKLFFDEPDFHFRAIVVDKLQLNHKKYCQTHNDFYYKMWWQCLTMIIQENNHYRIFIDIKDTLGNERIKKLQDILCHTQYISIQFRPETKGKHYSFWHLISENEGKQNRNENDRIPDIRRCERIDWIAWLIMHYKSNGISWWKNKRGGNTHVVIWAEKHDFAIILAERKKYYLLKTAYCLKTFRRKQFIKERNEWENKRDKD